jgi:SAM-dependent methyltransferase
MQENRVAMNARACRAELDYTGERVVPGLTPETTFRESHMRYAFAAQFVRGRRVLDVACGSGIGTDYLCRAGAVLCIGLDLDHSALGYAAERYGLGQLAACDATKLCLAGGSVDVVISFETIEHVADPGEFLRECERVLQPGGLLVCSTPNREITRWDNANPFHLAEMPIGEFCRKVREVFPDHWAYGQGPVSYPLYVAKKKIGGALEKLHLKAWARRRLRMRDDRVSNEVEFAGPNEDSRFAVSSTLPRWPNKPRYSIVVARKSTSGSG